MGVMRQCLLAEEDSILDNAIQLAEATKTKDAEWDVNDMSWMMTGYGKTEERHSVKARGGQLMKMVMVTRPVAAVRGGISQSNQNASDEDGANDDDGGGVPPLQSSQECILMCRPAVQRACKDRMEGQQRNANVAEVRLVKWMDKSSDDELYDVIA